MLAWQENSRDFYDPLKVLQTDFRAKFRQKVSKLPNNIGMESNKLICSIN